MSDKKSINEKLGDTLDVSVTDGNALSTSRSINDIIPKIEDEELVLEDREAEEDYYLVRKNLKEVIDNANVATEQILNVAAETDSARAYEVVGKLVQAQLEANRELIALHKSRKELSRDREARRNPQGGDSTQNNMIVMTGSTAEVLELLKRKRVENEAEGD